MCAALEWTGRIEFLSRLQLNPIQLKFASRAEQKLKGNLINLPAINTPITLSKLARRLQRLSSGFLLA